MHQLHVLIVDDEPSIQELLRDALDRWGHKATASGSARDALEILEGELFDAALVDIAMPGMGGLELLAEIKQRDPALDVVMVTGRPTVATAVQALRTGAADYLQKPLNFDELHHLLGRLAEQRSLRREVADLRHRLREGPPTTDLVGASLPMRRIRELVERVAASDSPVLIEGESGTGKEVVAAAVHRQSSRRAGPFVPVNCGAIPAELMESQLFGHLRGAFSGAVNDALGLLRSAQGGTIFLDEVAELSGALQVKLLRVLQDKRVLPVGSSRTVPVDVRVVAATNRALDEAVRSGAFRPDLFYRLNVVRIHLPALRDHKADIPALAAHFIRDLNRRFSRRVRHVTPEALDALLAYDFPGNVRELQNVLERAYALGARDEISLTDLPVFDARRTPPPLSELPTLAEAERELIVRALNLHADDKHRAARALGMSRRTLYRRLREYRLL